MCAIVYAHLPQLTIISFINIYLGGRPMALMEIRRLVVGSLLWSRNLYATRDMELCLGTVRE